MNRTELFSLFEMGKGEKGKTWFLSSVNKCAKITTLFFAILSLQFIGLSASAGTYDYLIVPDGDHCSASISGHFGTCPDIVNCCPVFGHAYCGDYGYVLPKWGFGSNQTCSNSPDQSTPGIGGYGTATCIFSLSKGFALPPYVDITDGYDGTRGFSIPQDDLCGQPQPLPAHDKGNTNPTPSCGEGFPVWSVNPVNLNHYVTDTPLWYKPPYGPSVDIQLSYNSLTALSGQVLNSPFGGKWQLNYASYIVLNPDKSVKVVMPDGREDVYTSDGLGGFNKPFGVFNTLAFSAQAQQYIVTLLDSTTYTYSTPPGVSGIVLTRITDAFNQSLSIHYDGTGKITYVQDALGRQTTFQYNGQGLVSGVTDPFNPARTAIFSYDSSGNLTGATDMGGFTTVYAYTPAYNSTNSYLSKIKSPKITNPQSDADYRIWSFLIEPNDGAPSSAAYPVAPVPIANYMGNKYRITITNPNNPDNTMNQEEYYYFGQNTWYVSPRDYVPYTVDGQGNITNNNYISGTPKTFYYFDRGPTANPYPKGRLAKKVTPTGTSKTFTYYQDNTKTSYGQVASITDGNNHTVNYQYDINGQYNTNGQITKYWDAMTPTTSAPTIAYSYYPNDIDVQTIDNHLGAPIAYEYNGAPHVVTAMTDRMNVKTAFGYDGYGRLSSMTEAKGDPLLETTTSFVYDAPNNTLHKILKHQGQQSDTLMGTFDFDDIGRLSDATYADGVYVTYQYAGLDQLSQTSYPDGKTEQISNNTSCPFMVNSTTDRAGLTTTYSYDALKRLYYKTVGPSGAPFQTFQYGYDANSNMTSFTDANGRATTFGYDYDNRLNLKTYADGKSVSYTYWPNGLLHTLTNGRLQTTTYIYDPNNNLTNINYPTGTPSVQLHYDPYNRLDYRIDGVGQFNYGYDANMRLLTVQYPWDTQPPLPQITITYHYNALGQLDTMLALGSQLITYGYDGIGRLSTIQRGSDAQYVYSYDTASSLSSPIVQNLVRPNSSYSQYQHNDALKKLTGLNNWKHPNTGSDSMINSYAYAYADPNHPDMISTETITNGTVIDNFVNGTTTYSYTNTDGTQNKVNQVQAINGTLPVLYDNDGNMTQAYTPAGYPMMLGYDAANRLTSAQYIDNQSVTHQTSYSYSGDGVLTEMIKKTEANQIWTTTSDVRYVRDGLLSVQEKDGLNNWIVTREYLWGKSSGGGIGGLLNLRRNSQDYNYLYDGKGNVVALIDSTQTPVDTYAYDSFGVLMKKSGTVDQPYLFSTKEYDADTGLSYYGFRFYDATLGRWMTKDPLGEYGDTNLYRAMNNNAVNWVDPLGLDSLLFRGKNVLWLDPLNWPIASYPAISGPFGKGKLPPGDYMGSNLRLRPNKKGMVCNKFGWSLDLNPSFPMTMAQSERTDLRIHPDQPPIGTEGCIGITCDGGEKRLYNDLRNYFNSGHSSIPVVVQY